MDRLEAVQCAMRSLGFEIEGTIATFSAGGQIIIDWAVRPEDTEAAAEKGCDPSTYKAQMIFGRVLEFLENIDIKLDNARLGYLTRDIAASRVTDNLAVKGTISHVDFLETLPRVRHMMVSESWSADDPRLTPDTGAPELLAVVETNNTPQDPKENLKESLGFWDKLKSWFRVTKN
jgi:hypothetical protein